jgi:hypothetical protein
MSETSRQLRYICLAAAKDIARDFGDALSDLRQEKDQPANGRRTVEAGGDLQTLSSFAEPLFQLLARQASRISRIYDGAITATHEAATPEIEEISRIVGRLDDLLSITYAKFYSYLFSALPEWLRQVYTDASILKFCLLFLSSPVQDGGQKRLDELVRVLDMALILAGGAGRVRGRAWIEDALSLLGMLMDDSPSTLFDAAEQMPIDRPAKRQKVYGHRWASSNSFAITEPFTPPCKHPIPRRSSLTLDGFQSYMDNSQEKDGGPQPLVMSGLIEEWPARTEHPWSKPTYLLSKTLNGARLVPVEIGRSYVDAGWGQQIIPFRHFLREYIAPSFIEAGSTGDKGESEKLKQSTGYLAQHQLFRQIPALREDIRIPDLCYTSPPKHPTDSSRNKPELDEPQLNAWFGPTGTITPLHTDPYHNLLVQVVGRKYVRLYAPSQSSVMRARGRENGVEMGNTSAVDVGVVEGWDERLYDEEQGPAQADSESVDAFRKAPYWDCILDPGDTLYIPIGWWHYVRSLTISFSVSFWWN